MAVAACTNVMGVNTAEVTNDALFGLGDNVLGDDGNQWIYGQYAAAINANTVCTYTKATGQITAAAGAHTTGGADGASGQYGWVRATSGVHG